MTNALNNSTVPAAPPVEPQPGPRAGGGGNALRASAGAQPVAPPQRPQITHGQAVAALRHFSAVSRELEQLMKDPELGRSSMKSKIIDSTTKLVAQRIITPAAAATQLGTLPSEPPLQRKWVQQHLVQAATAMNAVLDHHAGSNEGSGDYQIESARSQYRGDDHMRDMAALMSGYGGGGSKRA